MFRVFRFAVAATCGALLVPACLLAAASPATTPADGPADTASPKAAARAANQFAFDFYATQAGGKGSLVFSPASVHIALSMTAAGATDATRDQMKDALHYDSGAAPAAAGYGQMLAALKPGDIAAGPRGRQNEPAFALQLTNGLWVQNGFAIEPAFVKTVADDFHADVTKLDFARDAAGAIKTINDAIAKATKDRIKDLLPPGSVDGLTRLVLTNAVYLKARWQNTFPEYATQDQPFDGGDLMPMMHHQARDGYAETDTTQLLELPYAGGELSMIVLLPKERGKIAEFEKSLSADTFAKMTGQLAPAKVNVTLPKFKFEFKTELSGALKQLGMTDAFSREAAHFGKIATGEPLYISAVIHQAMIDVDENGTEAAAATAVTMRTLSARPGPPEEVKTFTADHPFVFVVRHNKSGLILFMGRMG